MTRRHSEGHPRLLRRREAIVVLGGGIGAIWHASRGAGAAIRSVFAVPTTSAASTCVLSPEQTEGPYYVANEPFRWDITEDRPGVPLKIRFAVQDVTTCKIKGATVEIWHADAGGTYSGINGATTTFLRGQQTTNAAGRTRFTTIYPGWYMGRTTHIHVKVHVGGAVVHTGQLYFDDAVTDTVYTQQPYAAHGQRDTTNASDGIYASGGAQSMLKLHKMGKKGYRARITLAVQT